MSHKTYHKKTTDQEVNPLGSMERAIAGNSSTILDQISAAVITTDLNNTINSWSKGAEHRFGYLPEEVIGKDFSSLFTEISDSLSPNEVTALCRKRDI